MTAFVVGEERRRLLVSVLEFSDTCVTAVRAEHPDAVHTLLDELVRGGGERLGLVLRHWAYLLVDFCSDQMPDAALAAESEPAFARPSRGRYDETRNGAPDDGGLVEQFRCGEGEAAKAWALDFVLQAGVDRDEDLMWAAVTTISTWSPPDQTEFAAILLSLVAANLPRHCRPSAFVYLAGRLFDAAEPGGLEDLVLPLARLVTLHWAEYLLGTETLAVESIRLIGLDYPTPARRAAAIGLLCRVLARGYAPGEPVTSTRPGCTLSDASSLPPANEVDTVDIIACRMIARAAAGRAGEIPGELTRLTDANNAQALLVLLGLARKLAHHEGERSS
jgi:hypothetical protein